jgi:hypothetical protein
MARARSRAAERGAATVEALVLLPAFFLIWALVHFVHGVMAEKILVGQIARTCAWEHMTSGCETPPPRCTIASGAEMADDDLVDGVAAVAALQAELQAYRVDVEAAIGPIFRPFFGVTRKGEVARPALVGEGAAAVAVQLSTMCNDRPGEQTVVSVATPSFCALTGWCQP